MAYLDTNGLERLWSKIKKYVDEHTGASGSFLNAHPVGSIYISVNSTNPGDKFGGTWVAWGSGRVPVGIDTSQKEFNGVEKTGGEKTHKLTVSEMPSHSHDNVYHNGAWTGTYTPSNDINSAEYGAWGKANLRAGGGGTINTGGGNAHNNLSPYITCYMWKRTA